MNAVGGRRYPRAVALYRKYRPATFAEVVGQEHVTDPLSTALDTGRISHAYLFSGPRGCGKTSSARILARSLNCVEGPTSRPCGVCSSCVALAPGGPGNLDVIELDAASHGGVDDTRELRDRAFYAPAESRYRVFIVDEAHMVTTAGFNALLKIVEEPPAHLIFIFATTEPDKVLPTIRSRTHHYPFRLLPPATMRGLLGKICEQENVQVEEAVYPLVIRAGGGSPRDSLSVLDQLLAGAGAEGVTYQRALALLGVTDIALIDEAVEALAAGDGAALFGTVDRVVEAGHDPRRFATDLLERMRDLILLRAVPDAADRNLVTGPGDVLDRMRDQAHRIGPATLTRYAELLHEGLGEMRGATAPRLLLEVVCARMLLPAVSDAESATLQRLERLERGMAGGAPATPRPATNQGAPSYPASESAPAGQPAPASTGGSTRRRGAEALAALRAEKAPSTPSSTTGPATRGQQPSPARQPAPPQSAATQSAPSQSAVAPQSAVPQPEPSSAARAATRSGGAEQAGGSTPAEVSATAAQAPEISPSRPAPTNAPAGEPVSQTAGRPASPSVTQADGGSPGDVLSGGALADAEQAAPVRPAPTNASAGEPVSQAAGHSEPAPVAQADGGSSGDVLSGDAITNAEQDASSAVPTNASAGEAVSQEAGGRPSDDVPSGDVHATAAQAGADVARVAQEQRPHPAQRARTPHGPDFPAALPLSDSATVVPDTAADTADEASAARSGVRAETAAPQSSSIDAPDSSAHGVESGMSAGPVAAVHREPSGEADATAELFEPSGPAAPDISEGALVSGASAADLPVDADPSPEPSVPAAASREADASGQADTHGSAGVADQVDAGGGAGVAGRVEAPGSAEVPGPAVAAEGAGEAEDFGAVDAGAAGVPEGDVVREVEAKWGEIRGKVREFGAAVHALLSGASVARVEGDTIVFAHQHAPLAQRLSNPKNVEAVQGAVHAVLGREFGVRWEVGAGAATSGGRAQSGTAPASGGRTQSGTAPASGGRAQSGAANRGGPAQGRGAAQSGGGQAEAPRFTRPSQSRAASPEASGSTSARGRESSPAGNDSSTPPPPPDDDIPLPDGPDLPDDPGPSGYSSVGYDSVPPAPTPEEEQEMLAESARPAPPGDRRDPDEVALELLVSELGATRLEA